MQKAQGFACFQALLATLFARMSYAAMWGRAMQGARKQASSNPAKRAKISAGAGRAAAGKGKAGAGKGKGTAMGKGKVCNLWRCLMFR